MLPSRGIAYRTNTFVPGRPTLLFIHGLSGSLSAWYPYEQLFEQQYNLITFDLRGHGLSAHPPRSGYRMEEFVEDTRALLAHLGVERATIVSHSLGTLVAMEYIRTHIARVERAIYLAPAYGVSRFFWRKHLAQLGAALARVPLRLRPYGRTAYEHYTPTRDWSPGRILADIAHMGLRSYCLALSVVFERAYESEWPKAAVPTLIVHGGTDSFIPLSYARELAAALPGARLHEIADANHILIMNNIPEVAECIQKFVGQ